MEDNIADALKMAGSVLLFVLGLSICMLAYSQAREATDAILTYADRESLAIDNNARYYYLAENNDTSRYVGKETIIPTIYRAYKENYKIIFEFPDDYYLFKKDNVEVKNIDLQNQSIANDLASRQFLDGIIYGNKITNYENIFGITPNNRWSLYEYLSNNENRLIKESLGTYYVDDVGGTPTEVEEVNKVEKRVITYTFE